MDAFSARLALLATGHETEQPVIEVSAAGVFSWVFSRECTFVVTGKGMSLKVDDKPAPLHQIVRGKCADLKPNGDGGWVYISIAEGLVPELVLDSYSTLVRSGSGQLSAGILRAGATLCIGSDRRRQHLISIDEQLHRKHQEATTVRLLLGPEWEYLTQRSKSRFMSSIYQITPQSDRMGVRLEGARLEAGECEMSSSAVLPGTIQLPSSGHPIVLMNDGQTTGGYPRIGQVILADMGRLAQAMPSGRVRFRLVDMEVALDALRYENELILTIEKEHKKSAT